MIGEAEPARPKRVVLLGMMGSGKSSVGEALSSRTGWPFVDNDALVEMATRQTARELLARSGEAAMRAAETAALEAGLTLPEPVIVATAGGTVLDADNRRRIRGGDLVVWLHAPAEVLAARAVGADHRPWLDDDPVGWFRRAIDERAAMYAEVSDLRLDTSELTASEAAGRITDAMTPLGPIPSPDDDRE